MVQIARSRGLKSVSLVRGREDEAASDLVIKNLEDLGADLVSVVLFPRQGHA